MKLGGVKPAPPLSFSEANLYFSYTALKGQSGYIVVLERRWELIF